MDETFILNRYTPDFLPVEENDIVVDIGSHIGDFSILAHKKGASKIFAYEPDNTNHKNLKKNIQNNRIKNIIAINKAVTDKKGFINFYENENNGGSSIYKVENKVIKRKVKSISLEDVFKENKLDRIDFLKIDCEGSEGLIFKNIKRDILNKINKISLEYHNNVSIMSDAEITKLLERNGFDVKKLKISTNFGHLYAKRPTTTSQVYKL